VPAERDSEPENESPDTTTPDVDTRVHDADLTMQFWSRIRDSRMELIGGSAARAERVLATPAEYAELVEVNLPDHLRAAFAYHPPYYHFEERVTNYVDYGPQNSRGFRALKVWLALKQGTTPCVPACLPDHCRAPPRPTLKTHTHRKDTKE